MLDGDRQRLANCIRLASIRHGAVVRGNEEVALFGYAQCAEQCAGAAELQAHFDSEFMSVLLGDGFHRLLEPGGTKDRQRRRGGAGSRLVLVNRHATQECGKQEENGGELFHGCRRIVRHARALPSTSSTAAATPAGAPALEAGGGATAGAAAASMTVSTLGSSIA